MLKKGKGKMKENKVSFYECEPARTFSLLELDELDDTIVISGNMNCIEKTTDLFNFVQNTLVSGDCVSMLDEFENGEETSYISEREIVEDYFNFNRNTYTDTEIELLEKLSREYLENCTSEMDDILCRVLSIVDKREWNYTRINGATQRQWQYVYYVAENWNDTALEMLKVEYFNTGAMYINDEHGSVYVHNTWNTDLIKKEISEYTGVKVEDIALNKIVGYTMTPKYEEI